MKVLNLATIRLKPRRLFGTVHTFPVSDTSWLATQPGHVTVTVPGWRRHLASSYGCMVAQHACSTRSLFLQALQCAHRDMSAFFMPDTLMRLLALGKNVITVADIFTHLLPFSTLSMETCKKYATKIRYDETLSTACAAVCPDLNRNECNNAACSHLSMSSEDASITSFMTVS